MPKQSLEDRVAILERALGSALAIDISGFDPVAQETKRKAEAKAAEEKAAAREAEAKAILDAQTAALYAEEQRAKADEDARLQATLKSQSKKK
jgi:hypothetical protein